MNDEKTWELERWELLEHDDDSSPFPHFFTIPVSVPNEDRRHKKGFKHHCTFSLLFIAYFHFFSQNSFPSRERKRKSNRRRKRRKVYHCVAIKIYRKQKQPPRGLTHRHFLTSFSSIITTIIFSSFSFLLNLRLSLSLSRHHHYKIMIWLEERTMHNVPLFLYLPPPSPSSSRKHLSFLLPLIILRHPPSPKPGLILRPTVVGNDSQKMKQTKTESPPSGRWTFFWHILSSSGAKQVVFLPWIRIFPSQSKPHLERGEEEEMVLKFFPSFSVLLKGQE